jgi:hypothetical protein
VYKWVRAENSDIVSIKEEIERAHRLTSKELKRSLHREMVIRTFNEYFRITDCGHIRVRRDFDYERRSLPFEDRLKAAVSAPLPPSISLTERDANQQLKEACEKLLTKIDELCKLELITPAVKRDADGNLRNNEICFLCEGCTSSYLNKYEMLPPCRGFECLFKSFTNKLAEQLKSDFQFVDVYNFGILRHQVKVIISTEELFRQPPANLARFDPKLILVVLNFFRDRYLPHAQSTTYRYVGVLPRIQPSVLTRTMEPSATINELNLRAFEFAMKFMISTLIYDSETGNHVYIPVGKIPPPMEKIVQRLASIEVGVKPTEKVVKAFHDQIVDICQKIGFELGFKSEKEHKVGTDRIDVGWLDKTTGELEVGIEVELGASILGDLWKLSEARPKLAVLMVKGGYYQNALGHATRSEIIRKLKQKLMVLDISSKDYVIVNGKKLLSIRPR